MISTNKEHAKHLFAGQNTQQIQVCYLPINSNKRAPDNNPTQVDANWQSQPLTTNRSYDIRKWHWCANCNYPQKNSNTQKHSIHLDHRQFKYRATLL